MSNSVPRPVPNSSATMMIATIGTHGLRALWASQCQNHSRSAVVRKQPREKGLEGLDLAARWSDAPAASSGCRRSGRLPSNVGRGLSERHWTASICARSGCVIQASTTDVFLSPPRGPSSTIV